MRDSSEVITLLERQKALQKLYAASGSAPAHVFSKASLSPPLSTCYPIVRLRNMVPNATHDDVVVYNNVITSQGPGSALLFAVELGELLFDDTDKANLMAQKLCLDRDNGFRRAVKRGRKRQVTHEPQPASERAATREDAKESQPVAPMNQEAHESSSSKLICKRQKCNGATLRTADECAVSFEYSGPRGDEATDDSEDSKNDEDPPTVAVLHNATQAPPRKRAVCFNFPLVQSRVWKPLEEIGWTTATPGRSERHYYPPAGLSAKNGAKNRFRTLTEVINFIRADVDWKDREDIGELIAAYDEISGTGIATAQRALPAATNSSGAKRQRGSDSSVIQRNDRKMKPKRSNHRTTGKRRKITTSVSAALNSHVASSGKRSDNSDMHSEAHFLLALRQGDSSASTSADRIGSSMGSSGLESSAGSEP
jgi:hypothetical protein